MTPQEFDRILAQTLQDRRLSGSERTALAQLLADRDANARAALRSRAFAAAKAALGSSGDADLLDWLDDVLKVFDRAAAPPPAGAAVSEACFSPGHNCPAKIAELFRRAKTAVDVCVFTITDDRIAGPILAAHQRGVRLRILSDNEKELDPGSDVPRLRDAGVPVRIDRSPYHMHHKFAIFDGASLLTGSYNWTRGAATNNEENFLVTGDPNLVRAFAAEFERLWGRWV